MRCGGDCVIRNVADKAVEPPERSGIDQDMDRRAIGRFLKRQQTTIRRPFELALLTGMRRGELLGLRWADVDTDRGVVTVRRTLIERARPCRSARRRRTVRAGQ